MRGVCDIILRAQEKAFSISKAEKRFRDQIKYSNMSVSLSAETHDIINLSRVDRTAIAGDGQAGSTTTVHSLSEMNDVPMLEYTKCMTMGSGYRGFLPFLPPCR